MLGLVSNRIIKTFFNGTICDFVTSYMQSQLIISEISNFMFIMFIYICVVFWITSYTV